MDQVYNVAFGVLGLVLTGLGVRHAVRLWRKYHRSVRRPGTVVGHHSRPRLRNRSAIVTFVDEQGRERQVVSHDYVQRPAAVGRVVTVLYPPDEPQSAEMFVLGRELGTVWCLLVAGLGLVGMAAASHFFPGSVGISGFPGT